MPGRQAPQLRKRPVGSSARSRHSGNDQWANSRTPVGSLGLRNARGQRTGEGKRSQESILSHSSHDTGDPLTGRTPKQGEKGQKPGRHISPFVFRAPSHCAAHRLATGFRIGRGALRKLNEQAGTIIETRARIQTWVASTAIPHVPIAHRAARSRAAHPGPRRSPLCALCAWLRVRTANHPNSGATH